MEAECTLRAAIEQANYTPGADIINFAIPGTGVHAIVPVTQLPTITGPVTINGYSQPGAQPNQKAVGSDAVLKIELNGAEAMGTEGLKIEASNSTVKGLVINNWHYAGVRIDGSGATGNRIRGNYIGTDASGTKDLGNSSDGVGIEDGSGSTVGGATAAERNVISGNKGNGIGIYGGGNRIAGNYVGTDKNGTAPLGNAVGVDIHEASNNYVGGTTADTRNVISASLYDGVSIRGNASTGNRVLSNFIFSNGELGINLAGITANDPDDPDTGPNNLQNFPMIASAKTGALKTTINARLNSTPNRTFRVQFFSNPAGGDEGKKFIGQKSVTTDGSGNVSFALSRPEGGRGKDGNGHGNQPRGQHLRVLGSEDRGGTIDMR